MDKTILETYTSAIARRKYLLKSIDRIERKMDWIKEEGYCVADSVTCGKKGKKPLETVVVRGFPRTDYERKSRLLRKRQEQLETDEEQLLELTTQVEEFISEIQDVEMRNILSLYYIDDLNWVQVAHRMNKLYGSSRKRYTDGGCRMKHERFLKKF